MRHAISHNGIGLEINRFRLCSVSCAAALLSCFAFTLQAKAIDLNFANLDGTEVDFSSGGFTFTTNSSGYQFSISSVTGGTGDSVGLDGYIAPGGPFTIGNIVTIGAVETASVTGSGMLHITDRLSDDLTGTVEWQNITTLGTGGIINLTGVINLTDITYSGRNLDLKSLALAGSASDVVTFQFTPPMPLDELVTTGGETSYSGSIDAVPEPGTLTPVGMGLGLFAWLRPSSKRLSKSN